ncbi:transmembrane signal receptor [Lithospermum erythrorhizon]|uniref:Transmembrane signal receptor n=1 Tax=Lithospermum erythrorhizon TaxID=34254 RepID=A0AAV3S0X4_LITER
MLWCKASSTPIELGSKDKMFQGEPVDRTRYQKLVGKLIYLPHTRLDIAFAVSLVSQYMHNPCQGHLDIVYRILKYLKQAPGKGLFYKRPDDRTIKVFRDADWVVWGNLVTRRSKKQNVIARSNAEAESRAMTHGVCEVICLKRIYEELVLEFDGQIQLYCDNQSTINIAHNHVQHDRTKHVEVYRHFIKEKIEGKLIKISHVSTGQQLTDILTKELSDKQYHIFLSKLELIKIYHPA